MTIEQFLKWLKTTPRSWALYGKSIRQNDTSLVGYRCCPQNLHAHILPTECKDMSIEDKRRIWAAADGEKYAGGELIEPKLRKQLLKACGLKEPRR